MRIFAVAMMSFHENQLLVERIEASTPQEAVADHTKLKSTDGDYRNSILSKTIDEIKDELFNSDMVMDVLEI